MIPKIIHYCWFGHNPKSELIERCIESWRKFCPDYEIKEWNEDNFDYTQCQYAADAYKEKKWGFVPDFIRLKLIYDYGGIYLDTDVELLKSLDALLEESAVMGFENKCYVNSGSIIMSEPGNTIIKSMYEMYYDVSFYNEDSSLNLVPSPKYNTEVLVKYGLQQNNTKQTVSDGVSQITVFPTEYFCPKDFESGQIAIFENTYSIHHYDGSWFDDFQISAWEYRRKIFKKYKNKKVCMFFVHLYCLKLRIKHYGILKTLEYYIK